MNQDYTLHINQGELNLLKRILKSPSVTENMSNHETELKNLLTFKLDKM